MSWTVKVREASGSGGDPPQGAATTLGKPMETAQSRPPRCGQPAWVRAGCPGEGRAHLGSCWIPASVGPAHDGRGCRQLLGTAGYNPEVGLSAEHLLQGWTFPAGPLGRRSRPPGALPGHPRGL